MATRSVQCYRQVVTCVSSNNYRKMQVKHRLSYVCYTQLADWMEHIQPWGKLWWSVLPLVSVVTHHTIMVSLVCLQFCLFVRMYVCLLVWMFLRLIKITNKGCDWRIDFLSKEVAVLGYMRENTFLRNPSSRNILLACFSHPVIRNL